MNNWNPDKYSKAWLFASLKHSGQKYGGFEDEQYIDYLNHIGSVAMEIVWFMSNTQKEYDADLAIQCALLHDTIEDTETTSKELTEHFGSEVAKGVQALTKKLSLPKEKQMMDSLTRIKKQPKEIWLVKMADRISNLTAPPFYWKKEKISAYREEAKIILQELGEVDEVMSNRLTQRIEEYFQKYMHQ